MPSARIARHMVAGLAAAVVVLAMVATAVVWRTGGADAASAQAAAAGDVEVVPAPPSSTTSSSTTTSTAAPTTTTPTTVKPKPVPTTVRTTVPRAPAAITPPPAPAAVAPPVAAPARSASAERCANARQWVALRGLTLPAGWGFRCPGQALENGTPRWGVACWNCEGDGVSWIAVDIDRIGPSDAALRYVIAHETCHANDYMVLGLSNEIGADLCAALHGAPRP